MTKHNWLDGNGDKIDRSQRYIYFFDDDYYLDGEIGWSVGHQSYIMCSHQEYKDGYFVIPFYDVYFNAVIGQFTRQCYELFPAKFYTRTHKDE